MLNRLSVFCLLSLLPYGGDAAAVDNFRPGAGNLEGESFGAESNPALRKYAVIDLGASMNPLKITNSGWVSMGSSVSSSVYKRWHEGVTTDLAVPSGHVDVYWDPDYLPFGHTGVIYGDITEDGTVYGGIAEITGVWYHNYKLRAATWAPNSSAPSVQPLRPELYAGMFYGFTTAAWDMYIKSDGVNIWSEVSPELPENSVWEVQYSMFMTFNATNGVIIGDVKFPVWVPGEDPGPAYEKELSAPSYVINVNTSGQALYVMGDGKNVLMELAGDFVDLGFAAVDLSNVVTSNQKTYVVGRSGVDVVWWDGQLHSNELGTGVPYDINAATGISDANFFLVNQPAVQIIGEKFGVGEVIWEMNPNSGSFGMPVLIKTLLDENSDWVSVKPKSINDKGIIVGTATKSGQSHGVMLVPVEISTTSSPYTVSAPIGPVNNVISAWPNVDLELVVDLKIDMPEASLPPNSISWSVPNHAVDANKKSATVSWSSAGTRQILITVFGLPMRVVIDVPYVGNFSENVAASMDPLGAISAFFYAEEAQAWAAVALADDGNNNGVRKANALQHSYWNALMASDSTVGPARALFFSTAHEFSTWKSGGIPYDSTMDLHNNSIGAVVIHTTLGLPDTSAIQEDLLSRLSAGDLWIINKFRPGYTMSHVIKSNGEKIYPLH